MTPEQLAKKMVHRAATKPSSRFGDWIPDVDDLKLGKSAASFRRGKQVEAQVVASTLGLTKGQMSLLENGKRKWEKSTLLNYILAVVTLAKKG